MKSSGLQTCIKITDPDYNAYGAETGLDMGSFIALEIIFSIPGLGD